jgi:hypothetical protein
MSDFIKKILNEGLNKKLIYHGGDIQNLKSLLKNFVILSPEEKLKLPSTGGGHIGLSASTIKEKALNYSLAFGNDKVLVMELLPSAKVLKIKKEIDSLTYIELEDLQKKGYDFIIEDHNDAENEIRILNSNKVRPLGIE